MLASIEEDNADMGVSIPSSSGHQFTAIIIGPAPGPPARRFNPFFIRASVYCRAIAYIAVAARFEFQSLLHQGISLLNLHDAIDKKRVAKFQSLLHQGISLLIIKRNSSVYWKNSFQSLLHQGISLLNANSARRRPVSLASTFQSLLHQGISLLTLPAPDFGQGYPSFNPFFIRASVY